jgi:hypothetical protein
MAHVYETCVAKPGSMGCLHWTIVTHAQRPMLMSAECILEDACLMSSSNMPSDLLHHLRDACARGNGRTSATWGFVGR